MINVWAIRKSGRRWWSLIGTSLGYGKKYKYFSSYKCDWNINGMFKF